MKLVANCNETRRIIIITTRKTPAAGPDRARLIIHFIRLVGRGPHLDVQDPEVGDQIPARRAVAVVAVEPEAGGVVDGVR